jgi:hypothetical protein
MEEQLCLMQQRVGLQQLGTNMELEKQISDKDEDSEIGLDVLGDTCWDKWTTESNYNPDSGCHLITGNRIKKVLAACPLSRQCGKREMKLDHPKELCPKNYDESSKGMEAYCVSVNIKS